MRPAPPVAWRHLPAVLLFTLLPIGVTWPLAWHLGTHIPGDTAGDNLSFLWSFWWMREALASSSQDFFHTTFLFYPFGVDLVQHTHTALNAWLGATLLGGTSIVAAQNIVLLLVLALAGFGTYLLAWDATRHRGAALIAGLFFAAAPFVAARLMGHYNLASAWGLPCFACACLRALRCVSTARAAVAAVVAGLLFGAVGYTDYYYLVYLMVFVPCVLAVRWIRVSVTRTSPQLRTDAESGAELGAPHSASPGTRTPLRQWTWIDTTLLALLAIVLVALILIGLTGGFSTRIAGVRLSMTGGLNLRTAAWVLVLILGWRRLRPRVAVAWRDDATVTRDLGVIGAVLIVGAVAIAPLLAYAVEIWQRGDYRSLDIRWHSAPAGVDPVALVFGNPFHPILGPIARALYDLLAIDRVEAVAWFGVVPLVLLIANRRHWLAPGSAARHEATLWLVVGGLFFLWALGPYLRIGGNTGLWLPASLVQYVPVLSNARLPSRALVMVYLSVAILLAVAIASRQGAIASRPGAVGSGKGAIAARPAAMRARTLWAIGVAVLIDFAAVPIPLYEVVRRPLYAHLATLPPGAVCVLPVGLRDGIGELGRFEHRALFDQSIHRKPLVGGFIARLPARVVREYQEAPILWSLVRLSSGETLSDDELAHDRLIAGDSLRRMAIRYIILNRNESSAQLRQYVSSVLPATLLRVEDHLELYALE